MLFSKLSPHCSILALLSSESKGPICPSPRLQFLPSRVPGSFSCSAILGCFFAGNYLFHTWVGQLKKKSLKTTRLLIVCFGQDHDTARWTFIYRKEILYVILHRIRKIYLFKVIYLLTRIMGPWTWHFHHSGRLLKWVFTNQIYQLIALWVMPLIGFLAPCVKRRLQCSKEHITKIRA